MRRHIAEFADSLYCVARALKPGAEIDERYEKARMILNLPKFYVPVNSDLETMAKNFALYWACVHLGADDPKEALSKLTAFIQNNVDFLNDAEMNRIVFGDPPELAEKELREERCLSYYISKNSILRAAEMHPEVIRRALDGERAEDRKEP